MTIQLKGMEELELGKISQKISLMRKIVFSLDDKKVILSQ